MTPAKTPESVSIVCIVGAGRSGTNLLARALAADPRFINTFENRYVWNYGQKSLRTDIRNADEATERVAGFIRHHFVQRRGSGEPARIVIDKTPGNALRLSFVARVFPQVKVVNILRGGRANWFSRKALWDETDPEQRTDQGGRVARLVRQIGFMRRTGSLPAARLPVFFADNLPNYTARLLRGRPPLAGERIPGLREIARLQGIDVARAVQWRDTVLTSVFEGEMLGPDRYIEFNFDEVVTRPEATMDRLFGFLGLEAGVTARTVLAAQIDPDRANRRIDCDEQGLPPAIAAIIEPTMTFLDARGWGKNRAEH